ncbi:MAG: FAD-dependent oxidoreductase [Syntrophomonas sp.]
MQKKYSALFSPGKIGGLTVKNRVVMAPMLVSYGLASGEVSPRLIDYYEARARGGVGIIIVEAACVHPSGMEASTQLRIDQPRFISGLEHLAETIKAHGVGAFIQLLHAGRQTSSLVTGEQPVAPSPLACPVTREAPRGLSIDEVNHLEKAYIEAARNAARAGFDGVELHAAHGYLINQFLSPHSNQRRDEYGGSTENRMRFLVNILSGIKKAEPGLIISVRLNMDDFVPGGLQLEESVQIAARLEEEGANLIHCSSGTYESGLNSIEPSSYREGWRAYLAGEVKKWVKIPVISGGILCSPAFANQLIESGQADYIFLGRSLLADPDWVNKVKQGAHQRIRPCLLCNRCIESNFKGLSVRCTVNFWTGREAQQMSVKTTSTQNRVAVIGSGPAGMQAALSLKKLGFEVKVFEKSAQPGGLLNLACRPPHKHRLARYRDYLLGELEHYRVPIILNCQFTAQTLLQEEPDYVVVATGSRPVVPTGDIKWDNAINMADILEDEVQISNKNVAIIGGGSNGCETADYLIKMDNRVVIIEKESVLAGQMEKKNRRDMMNRLDKAGVVKMTGSTVVALEEGWVIVDTQLGQERLEADLVVLAVGYQPDKQLYCELNKIHPRVFLIGDAYQVSNVRNAVVQAETIAQDIYRMSWE